MAVGDPHQPLLRLTHFTPLRYPGGKGKLAPYIKSVMKANGLQDGEYIEPYAGGAAVALELLFHEYVSRIHINDISKPIYSFWNSVLRHTEDLCRLVTDTPLTVEAWDLQKRVLANQDQHDEITLGFAMFFLNRTNRSGILNGGIIGGRDQAGPWKIDARFNARELVHRIVSIASMRSRIHVTCRDALKFLRSGVSRWPEKALIYLDPPYYEKGRELYYDFYQNEDHKRVARFITESVNRQRWIVSYDNVSAIRDLYEGAQYVTYDIGYSARSSRQGSEIMFFSESLRVPPLFGPITLTMDRTRRRGTRAFSGASRG